MISPLYCLCLTKEHLEGDVNDTCRQEAAEGQPSGAADQRASDLTTKLTSALLMRADRCLAVV